MKFQKKLILNRKKCQIFLKNLFPEIRFLLYSELFKYVKMGLVYTIEKDYCNKYCRKGWETDAKTLYYADIKALMISTDNAYGNVTKETIEIKYPKFI